MLVCKALEIYIAGQVNTLNKTFKLSYTSKVSYRRGQRYQKTAADGGLFNCRISCRINGFNTIISKYDSRQRITYDPQLKRART